MENDLHKGPINKIISLTFSIMTGDKNHAFYLRSVIGQIFLPMQYLEDVRSYEFYATSETILRAGSSLPYMVDWNIRLLSTLLYTV
jgi:hypothetical protein